MAEFASCASKLLVTSGDVAEVERASQEGKVSAPANVGQLDTLWPSGRK